MGNVSYISIFVACSLLNVYIFSLISAEQSCLKFNSFRNELSFLISFALCTRTSLAACIPYRCFHESLFYLQDPKLRDTSNMGSTDVPIEDKTVTIVYGPDFVNVDFINFVTNSKEVAVVCNG